MIKVKPHSYSDYISYAEECACGKVYPLSIAQGYQQGDIFTNSDSAPKTVLFWHYSGFAFVSGEYDESFLNEVYDIIADKENANTRRIILFTDDARTKAFFDNKEDVDTELRYFYEHKNNLSTPAIDLPCGCELKPIDAELLPMLRGRITPYFSWDNEDEFLSKGMGYCIVCDGEAAAWAFSAAVSDNEIDIGVETQENYQHRGLAAIVSQAMINYALSEGKAPVWACHYKNIASAKLAEKTGFEKVSECFVMKRNHE